jgi:hypothetical protein
MKRLEIDSFCRIEVKIEEGIWELEVITGEEIKIGAKS